MPSPIKAKIPTQSDDETASARPDVKLGELSGFIGFYLRMAQTMSFQAYAKDAAAAGRTIRAGHFAVLTLIGENPGITQTALSRANGRDKSSLTPVIDELERRGFVTRHRVESNRRAYSLQLTADGDVARRKLLLAAIANERRLESVLDPGDREELLRMLKLFTEKMAKQIEG
ncbi:MAG TPA: MarR family transcriptional regulator [Caulobacteraceae bacterium]|nr:MarR family transcriptional regulator [Caulobacteraceae bacterium]